jgi:hypothetical protein
MSTLKTRLSTFYFISEEDNSKKREEERVKK